MAKKKAVKGEELRIFLELTISPKRCRNNICRLQKAS